MEKESYESLKIENIVASGSIAESLDLDTLSEKLAGCRLERKRFPGAVYHMENPKLCVLFFSSGKIVITGIKNLDMFKKGLEAILTQLNDLGIKTLDQPEVSVTNMVCSYNTGIQINLNKLVLTFNYENIEYEPEQFPGLVYRLSDPKIVILLFSSGKLILTGGKNLGDVERAVDNMNTVLSRL